MAINFSISKYKVLIKIVRLLLIVPYFLSFFLLLIKFCTQPLIWSTTLFLSNFSLMRGISSNFSLTSIRVGGLHRFTLSINVDKINSRSSWLKVFLPLSPMDNRRGLYQQGRSQVVALEDPACKSKNVHEMRTSYSLYFIAKIAHATYFTSETSQRI